MKRHVLQRVVVLSFVILGLLLPLVADAADEVEMIIWVNNWQQKVISGIRDVANLFAERHPEVKSVTVVEGDQNSLAERLTLGVISNTPPDLIAMPAPAVQYALAGLLQPIDEFLAASALVSPTDYPPLVVESFTANGSLYALPSLEVGPGLCLIYSKDLFAEAGLADRGPETLEELYQIHKKMTILSAEGNVTQVGLQPLDAMGTAYFPSIWSTVFDLDWYDTTTNKVDMMCFEPAVEYIKRIYDTPGYELIIGAGTGGWAGAAASRRLAMQINGYWLPGELRGLGVDQSAYGYTWMPNVTGDKATAIAPWGYGIPSGAQRPDLSFALMEFFASAEASQMMFNACGYLNGNMTAIRELDISGLPVVAPIVAMFDEADRINAPPPVPMLEQIRARVRNELGAVWRTEQPPRIVLDNLQKLIQQDIDEALAPKVKAEQ
ncbi:MAG: extracellular solute-binding protein [Limnochordia bacterium]